MIFDLDGTLVDSMWMWKAIDIEYLTRKGVEVPERFRGFQDQLERIGIFRDSRIF